MPPSRRDENAEATKRAILKAARRIFGKRGYAHASLEAITADARVTTGAVYHHFGGKEGLFRSVAEDVEVAILEAVREAAATETNSWKALMAGVAATLEMAVKPEIRQIAFIDAPRVIGPAEWRAIESKYAYGMLQAGLAQLAREGVIKPMKPEIVAPILLGALIEAAHAVADAKGAPAARAEALKTIEAILAGLRRTPA
jgi:AcrR family transcriptional regulator